MNSKPSPSLTRAFDQAADELRRLQTPNDKPADELSSAMTVAARRIRESAAAR